MSGKIDIEDIFRRNKTCSDGLIHCSLVDWNNIVKYINDLELEVNAIQNSPKDEEV